MSKKTLIEKRCKLCDKAFTTLDNRKQYCGLQCASIAGHQIKAAKSLEDWLKTGKLDYKPNTMIKVGSVYRNYIAEEQKNRCAICGMNAVWNNRDIVFILDHIDGNSSNHCRSNLRLVCPNCDSQLDTYKSRNKHSARIR